MLRKREKKKGVLPDAVSRDSGTVGSLDANRIQQESQNLRYICPLVTLAITVPNVR